MWKVTSGECIRTLAVGSVVTSVNYSNEGVLASGSSVGRVNLWDVSTGECTKSLTGSRDRTIKLWNRIRKVLTIN